MPSEEKPLKSQIRYKSGYKYQLHETYKIQVDIKLGYHVTSEYINLDDIGGLTIYKGYAWDGASGPTIDTKSSMRGALVHDALYQLMRLGLLPESYRDKADSIAEEIWHEDGMLCIRHNWWDKMLHIFGKGSAKKGTERPVLTAP